MWRILKSSKLENLYYQAGVRYYHDDLKFLIQNVISDLYYADWSLLNFIRLEHVDRAVYKFKEASENKKIYNTRNYFRACLRSAIEELGIEE
jgi:hypothetical protein